MFLLRRGAPCHVRRHSEDRWRPHVCAQDRTPLSERLAYNETPAWLFAVEGWELLVEPRHLERDASYASTWHVGVTGTRDGLTAAQRAALREHLTAWLLYSIHGPPTFHHGGCVGADREAHELAREVWGKTAVVVIHPASDQPERLCDWRDADELREPLPSLVRNRDIVASVSEGSVLLALPKENREQRRSGTWATVRYARAECRGVVIFGPAE
ncbi:MAG: hypothetical protein E6Q76_02190 [Rhizobium sp.]|nr:MAG: hypothetical protein E6Q76_02190 [Rhizobium sp.]